MEAMKIDKIQGVHEFNEVVIRRIPATEDMEEYYDVFVHDFKFHAGEMAEAGLEVQDVVEQVLRKCACFLIDVAKSDRSDW
jgi:hypothetical protein